MPTLEWLPEDRRHSLWHIALRRRDRDTRQRKAATPLPYDNFRIICGRTPAKSRSSVPKKDGEQRLRFSCECLHLNDQSPDPGLDQRSALREAFPVLGASNRPHPWEVVHLRVGDRAQSGENVLKTSDISVYDLSVMTGRGIGSYWLQGTRPFLPEEVQTARA